MSTFCASEFTLPIDGGHRALRLCSAVQLDDTATSDTSGAVSSWVHFAPFGKWLGHEQGPLTFDRKEFETIVANFDKLENDLQVDYEHDSINKQLKGPKPAAGWIKALEIRGNGQHKGDGLWGFVEWVSRAVAFIRNREYKYTSPVIDPDAKDRKTKKKIGMELFNAALTNDPFLDGQMPLALERISMEIKIKDQKLDNTSDKQMNADDPPPEPESGGGVFDKIAAMTGMESAAVEAILLEKIDEVAALVAGSAEGDGTPADEPTANADTPKVAAADRWTKAMESRIAILERDKKAEKTRFILDHVNSKIEGGFILDSDKDLAIELYTENFDRAERVYGSQLVPLGRHQAKETRSTNGNKIKLSDAETASINGLISCGYSKQSATTKVVALRKGN